MRHKGINMDEEGKRRLIVAKIKGLLNEGVQFGGYIQVRIWAVKVMRTIYKQCLRVDWLLENLGLCGSQLGPKHQMPPLRKETFNDDNDLKRVSIYDVASQIKSKYYNWYRIRFKKDEK